MKAEEITEFHKLSNGAEIIRNSFDCEVCVSRGEQAEPSMFMVEYDGQQVNLCLAHTQELLDLDEDKLQKGGGIFGEVLGSLDEKA